MTWEQIFQKYQSTILVIFSRSQSAETVVNLQRSAFRAGAVFILSHLTDRLNDEPCLCPDVCEQLLKAIAEDRDLCIEWEDDK